MVRVSEKLYANDIDMNQHTLFFSSAERFGLPHSLIPGELNILGFICDLQSTMKKRKINNTCFVRLQEVMDENM